MSSRTWWRYLLPAEVRRLAWEEYVSILKIAVVVIACHASEWLLRWKWGESSFYHYLVRLDDWLVGAMVVWVLIERSVRFFKGRK